MFLSILILHKEYSSSVSSQSNVFHLTTKSDKIELKRVSRLKTPNESPKVLFYLFCSVQFNVYGYIQINKSSSAYITSKSQYKKSYFLYLHE